MVRVRVGGGMGQVVWGIGVFSFLYSLDHRSRSLDPRSSILEATARYLGFILGISKSIETPHILSSLLSPILCYPVTSPPPQKGHWKRGLELESHHIGPVFLRLTFSNDVICLRVLTVPVNLKSLIYFYVQPVFSFF